MDLALSHERLTRAIAHYGRLALDTRQVARRLSGLLQTRYLELRRDHARGGGARSGGRAERAALTDARYLAFVDELSSVSGQAAAARVQYETHAMLYQARQTLRALRR